MQEIHDENEQTGETKKEKERWRGDRDRGGWCARGDEASGPHNFHLNFGEQGDDGRPFWGGQILDWPGWQGRGNWGDFCCDVSQLQVVRAQIHHFGSISYANTFNLNALVGCVRNIET